MYHTKAKPETQNAALHSLGLTKEAKKNTREDILLKEYIIEFVSYKRLKKNFFKCQEKTIIRGKKPSSENVKKRRD